MPIFEYRCKGCHERFESLVMGSERPACPKCSGSRLEKLLSTFAALGGDRGASAEPAPGACGTCGDPRGPGACSLN